MQLFPHEREFLHEYKTIEDTRDENILISQIHYYCLSWGNYDLDIEDKLDINFFLITSAHDPASVKCMLHTACCKYCMLQKFRENKHSGLCTNYPHFLCSYYHPNTNNCFLDWQEVQQKILWPV